MDLIATMKLDKGQFESGIASVLAEMKKINASAANATGGVDLLSAGFLKLVGKIGGITGAVALAKKAFFNIVNAGSETSAQLEMMGQQWDGTVDSFFYHLNNTDIGGFLDKIGQITEAIKEAFEAWEDFQMKTTGKSVLQREINNKQMQLRSELYMTKDPNRKQEIRNELLKLNDRAKEDFTPAVVAGNKAANAMMRKFIFDFSAPTAYKYFDKELRSYVGNGSETLSALGTMFNNDFNPKGGYGENAYQEADRMVRLINRRFGNLEYVNSKRSWMDSPQQSAKYDAEYNKKRNQYLNEAKTWLRDYHKRYGVSAFDVVGLYNASKGKNLEKLQDVTQKALSAKYDASDEFLGIQNRNARLINRANRGSAGGGGSSTEAPKYTRSRDEKGRYAEEVYPEGTLGWYNQQIERWNKWLQKNNGPNSQLDIQAQINDLTKMRDKLQNRIEAPGKLKVLEDDYVNKQEFLNKQLDAKILSNDDYLKEMKNLAENTAKDVLEMPELGDAGDMFVKSLMQFSQELVNEQEEVKKHNEELKRDSRKWVMPVPKLNDTRMDYQMSKTDLDERALAMVKSQKEGIAGANKLSDDDMAKIEAAKGDFSKLKNEFGEVSRDVMEAIAKLSNMEIKLKVTVDKDKIAEDVKNLSEEVRDDLVGVFSQTVGSINSLYGSFTSMLKTMADAHKSAFEKIMSVADTWANTLSTVNSYINSIEKFKEVTERLAAAKLALSAVAKEENANNAEGTAATIANTGAQIANTTAKGVNAGATAAKAGATVAETTASAAETTAIAAGTTATVAKTTADNASTIAATIKGAETISADAAYLANTPAVLAASQARTAANENEAVTGAAAAHAKIPFVGIALAAAAIAAIIVLMSKNKFAEGGIVGGTSYAGDKIFARLNSGEMVLNQKQQASLYAQLNDNADRRMAAGGNVEFTLRGEELSGVLSNYNRRINKYR